MLRVVEQGGASPGSCTRSGRARGSGASFNLTRRLRCRPGAATRSTGWWRGGSRCDVAYAVNASPSDFVDLYGQRGPARCGRSGTRQPALQHRGHCVGSLARRWLAVVRILSRICRGEIGDRPRGEALLSPRRAVVGRVSVSPESSRSEGWCAWALTLVQTTWLRGVAMC